MSLATEFEKLKELRTSGAITQEEYDAAKNRLLDSCVRLIEASHNPKKVPAYARWGFPPARVVRGVVQNIHLAPRSDARHCAFTLEINGLQVDLNAFCSIPIESGDRVTLAGYEREGRIIAIACDNESKGAQSDLRRVRIGYRLFLTAGQASWLAGVAAFVATVIFLILHKPVVTFDSAWWRYVPYLLASLGSAAICYFGLCLSFVGARAKEFHDALPWAAKS